jgi:hypothetical protein
VFEGMDGSVRDGYPVTDYLSVILVIATESILFYAPSQGAFTDADVPDEAHVVLVVSPAYG